MAHLDLYRLGDADELEGIGFRDLLAGDYIVLVEWADRVDEALAAASVTITFIDQGPELRCLNIKAKDHRVCDAIRQRLPTLVG